MTTDQTRQLMLDIAMNCHRVGNWIADDYDGKRPRIDQFLAQTREYLHLFQGVVVPPVIQDTRNHFASAFEACNRDLTNPAVEKAALAERLMTWGNILTHRVTLLG